MGYVSFFSGEFLSKPKEKRFNYIIFSLGYNVYRVVM